MRSLLWVSGALLLLVGAAVWAFLPREQPLPDGLAGRLVYVSDRHGPESLHARRLPDGPERRLTAFADDVREPAISPDGRRVAFSLDGRIGVVSLDAAETRILTLGIDWRDAAPAWLPDAERLVVAARRNPGDNADLHLLTLPGPEDAEAERHPLLETPGLDESEPTVSPDGRHVVFVRRDQLYRLDLERGGVERLTGGFRSRRHPRFLRSGRIVTLWSAEKRHGIELLDADGESLQTLVEGSVYYRTVAPSPDGRFLAVTFTYDLAFHPAELLRIRQAEEVRLLSAGGEPLATLAGSWREAYHSPDWGL